MLCIEVLFAGRSCKLLLDFTPCVLLRINKNRVLHSAPQGSGLPTYDIGGLECLCRCPPTDTSSDECFAHRAHSVDRNRLIQMGSKSKMDSHEITTVPEETSTGRSSFFKCWEGQTLQHGAAAEALDPSAGW